MHASSVCIKAAAFSSRKKQIGPFKWRRRMLMSGIRWLVVSPMSSSESLTLGRLLLTYLHRSNHHKTTRRRGKTCIGALTVFKLFLQRKKLFCRRQSACFGSAPAQQYLYSACTLHTHTQPLSTHTPFAVLRCKRARNGWRSPPALPIPTARQRKTRATSFKLSLQLPCAPQANLDCQRRPAPLALSLRILCQLSSNLATLPRPGNARSDGLAGQYPHPPDCSHPDDEHRQRQQRRPLANPPSPDAVASFNPCDHDRGACGAVWRRGKSCRPAHRRPTRLISTAQCAGSQTSAAASAPPPPLALPPAPPPPPPPFKESRGRVQDARRVCTPHPIHPVCALGGTESQQLSSPEPPPRQGARYREHMRARGRPSLRQTHRLTGIHRPPQTQAGN